MLDSWAWIEYYRGSAYGKKVQRIIEGDEEAYISTLNIAEVFRWFLRYYSEEEAEEERTTMKQRCVVMAVDDEVAVEAAKIRHRIGFSLGDSIILATARMVKAKVVTGDRDFKGLTDSLYLGK